MPGNPKRHVRLFVSYSREDESIVRPVVQLLRVTESKVFLDIDSIAPGERWQEELESSLARADKVCVFWCLHSNTSEWVQREWQYAHQKSKKIVPLLLDSTPLTSELSEYQYINFTVVEGSLHPTKDGYYYPREPPPPGYSEEEECRRIASRIVENLVPIIEEDSPVGIITFHLLNRMGVIWRACPATDNESLTKPTNSGVCFAAAGYWPRWAWLAMNQSFISTVLKNEGRSCNRGSSESAAKETPARPERKAALRLSPATAIAATGSRPRRNATKGNDGSRNGRTLGTVTDGVVREATNEAGTRGTKHRGLARTCSRPLA